MPVPAGSSPPPPSPSGPIYYDPVLSRVRLSLSGLSVFDTFARAAVSPGWGTAGSGHVWGSTDPVFSTTGSGGRTTHAAAGAVRNILGGTSAMADVTAQARVAISQKLTGSGDMFPGLMLRTADNSNFYKFGLFYQPNAGPTGLVGFVIGKTVGGVFTLLASDFAFEVYNGTEQFLLKADCFGSTLRIKVWRDTVAEPVAWTATVTDSTFGVGSLGVESNRAAGITNVSPFITWDDITAVPTDRVERSTDLVRWSTVRGGEAAVLADGTLRLDDYEFTPDVSNHYRVGAMFAGSVVPVLGGVWLKSLARPYLNRQVTVRDYSDVSRRARAGVFDVVGRSYPVAVTDVRGSRQWSLDVSTYSEQARSELDLLLASGDILLVHVPPNSGRISATPGGYVTVGDTREATPPTSDLAMRVFTLPCTEVAAPGPDVVGATITCQGVLDAYATCSAMLAAHPTCLSLLELIGDPTDVVVP